MFSSLLPSLSLPANSRTDLAAAGSSGYGSDCCPPVVDPYTWLALIGGIALATFFLQQQIVMNIPVGGRRKRELNPADSVMAALAEFTGETEGECGESGVDLASDCRAPLWHCLSELVAPALPLLTRPGRLLQAGGGLLYRLAFPGRGGAWQAAMTLPQVRGSVFLFFIFGQIPRDHLCPDLLTKCCRRGRRPAA